MKWNIIKNCIKQIQVSYYLKQPKIFSFWGQVFIYLNVSDFQFNTIIISLYIFQRKFQIFEPSMELFGWRLHNADLKSVLYFMSSRQSIRFHRESHRYATLSKFLICLHCLGLNEKPKGQLHKNNYICFVNPSCPKTLEFALLKRQNKFSFHLTKL